MIRKLIINEIMKAYRDSVAANQELIVLESLKRINGDNNLIAFAIELGIDTDAVLAVRS